MVLILCRSTQVTAEHTCVVDILDMYLKSTKEVQLSYSNATGVERVLLASTSSLDLDLFTLTEHLCMFRGRLLWWLCE